MPKQISQLVSAVALFMLSPIFLLVALAIRLDSKGPVFFRQERVGKGGQLFKIHKFRTMYVHKIKVNISASGDSRVTKVGRILRKTKLDELPQLIDIVQGNMVLVGPRPEVPEYVQKWGKEAKQIILSVYPGITDPASIKYRNEADELAEAENPERYYVETILPKKVALYVKYAQTRSTLGDIQLILQTLKAVIAK